MNTLSYLGRGIAHEKQNLPCQDAVAYRNAENGNLILAVSDGASSAKYADQAAKTVVRAVVDFFERFPLEKFLAHEEQEQKESLLFFCSMKLRKLEKKNGPARLEDYSSTLLFCVMDDRHLLIGHIGDGVAFVMDDTRKTVFTSGPENIGKASNRTYFVTSLDTTQKIADHFFFHVMSLEEQPVASLVLMSDGPYSMFRARGGGRAEETAEEILGYIADGGLTSNEHLSDVLNQMAEVPSERLDDWSLLVADRSLARQKALPPVISMLREEEAKYARGDSHVSDGSDGQK